MPNSVILFFDQFTDIQNLGLNGFTINFILMVITSILGCYAYYRQAAKVWDARSAKSVNVVIFACMATLFPLFALQGVERSELVSIVQGVSRIPFSFAIMIGILKFKDLSRWEMLICGGFFAALVQAYFGDNVEATFSAFGVIGVIASAFWPFELRRTGLRGEASLPFMLIIGASTASWTVYAAAVDNAPLMWMSLGFTLTMIPTIYFWWKASPSTPPTSA